MQRSEREVPAWPLGSATSISLNIAIGLIFPFSLCQSPTQEATGAYHGTEDRSRQRTPIASPTPLHVLGAAGALAESLAWLLCTTLHSVCLGSDGWALLRALPPPYREPEVPAVYNPPAASYRQRVGLQRHRFLV